MDSENNLHPLSPSIDFDFSLTPAAPPGPDPRDGKNYYTYATPIRRIMAPVVLGIFHMLASVQVSGAEHLPPRGAVILASNHLTNFDVFPLQAALSRPIFFMGKAELYRQPVMDWFLRQLGSFPVQRGGGDVWAMRHARRVLCAGLLLGMFPEGRRSKGRGLGPAKTGVARLALDLGCPILPVGLHGTQYMFDHVHRRSHIAVRIAEPIYPEKSDTPLSLTDRMMFAIAGLLPPEQRGVYAHRVEGF